MPWASFRRAAAMRSPASSPLIFERSNPKRDRKSCLASASTEGGANGMRGITTWSTSPGRLMPAHAAGVSRTPRGSVRKSSR